MIDVTRSRVMHFADREDAGRQLAGALAGYRGQHPLVLAIPRGGVPVGRILADALDGELDVVLVRKLGAPHNPEFAIGAIDERGHIQRVGEARADDAYLRAEAARQLEQLRRRRVMYSPGRHPVGVTGRLVIIVDDGLATGATMQAAVAAVRRQHPASIVCAVPVAAPDSLARLATMADRVVCLSAPADFRAVGAFYGSFRPVGDEEVIRLLGTVPAAGTDPRTPEPVWFELPDVRLPGELTVPSDARGLVVFVHGSGSSRLSPRDRAVARVLQQAGLATLLFDLLTPEEDVSRGACFDIALLADRLASVVAQVRRDPALLRLPLGLFAAGTGAAAALAVAARRQGDVVAMVSRGGRPDLAGPAALAQVVAPTLLIVGGADIRVIELNRAAQRHMPAHTELVLVPGATHLFEEPGALEKVAELAAAWYGRHASAAGARREPSHRRNG